MRQQLRNIYSAHKTIYYDPGYDVRSIFCQRVDNGFNVRVLVGIIHRMMSELMSELSLLFE